MIQSQTYTLNNLLLTNELVTSYIDNFWNDIFANIVSNNKDKHLLILVKVHYTQGQTDEEGDELGYKTLGQLRRLNFANTLHTRQLYYQ